MEKENINILLLTDLTSHYSKSLLNGLVRFAKNKPKWTFLRMPPSYDGLHEDRIIDLTKKWKIDAIVAQITGIDIDELKKLNIPIIVQNYNDRIDGVCNFTGDYVGTGRMAASYFMNLGYQNFAFYGIGEAVWSRERLIGYRDELEKNGFELHNLSVQNTDIESWSYDLDALALWLKDLSEKTALFTCDDYYALRVSDICRTNGIPVPDKIAILGVDNDEMLCNISHPSLSSIVINAEEGGFTAGHILDSMFNGRLSSPVNITVAPVQVITRASTSQFAFNDKHVRAVVDYIMQNYMSKISVPDLLGLVPLSRRLFETRFREITGTSIYSFLCNYRTDRVCELLLTTDRLIEDIAISCGFTDSKNLSRVFAKHKGTTPSGYRKKGHR